MSIELLPCAFCQARLVETFGGVWSHPLESDCVISDSYITSEDAEAWNRRTPPCTPHEEPGSAKDDPHEFGAGILPNPKAKYWQERADFWREKAIELGWREYRDAAQETDAALSAALAIRGK